MLTSVNTVIIINDARVRVYVCAMRDSKRFPLLLDTRKENRGEREQTKNIFQEKNTHVHAPLVRACSVFYTLHILLHLSHISRHSYVNHLFLPPSVKCVITLMCNSDYTFAFTCN